MERRYKRRASSEFKFKGVHWIFAGALILIFSLLISIIPEGPVVGNCIAIVRLSGPISSEGSPPSLFDEGVPSSYDFVKLFERLEERGDVKAIVLEVNSPGGGVVPTREIYESLVKIEKPKVAYIREIGASGGYYVSLATDYIIANPNAITGSIGVITTFVDMRELLQNIGVNVTSITGGKNKDIGAFYRGLGEEERKIIEGIVNEIYEDFKGVVIERRGEKLKDPSKAMDGRIFTGKQAYELGLVDETGNLERAIEKAAELAGIEDYEECYFNPVQESFFAGAFKGMEINLNFGREGLSIEYR